MTTRHRLPRAAFTEHDDGLRHQEVGPQPGGGGEVETGDPVVDLFEDGAGDLDVAPIDRRLGVQHQGPELGLVQTRTTPGA